ncbi:MAG: transcriptional regulator, ArsR family [Devosia sp.]|uniref:rhodanese-like domain-containing protein n=1 Tax=Devosia sp. TaxID=1871048 RepID=UPI002A72E384|nr:transcriptional regulator, ArsR family [Devosia sp.]
MDSLEPISSKELLSRIRDHAVLLLDVRPEDEFAAGHLPTAQNITIETLEARLSDLPTDREIVAYCRGPYCVLSFKAVEALRTRGFKVRRLTDGYPEWKAAVLPVEA